MAHGFITALSGSQIKPPALPEVTDSYGRDRHKEYVKDIRTILDYLRRLNSQHSFANWLARVVPKLKTQTIALNSLMENMRKEIDTLETELDSLRLEEKEMWIAKGKDFTLNV